jgi:hypothetical protein
VRDVVVDLLQDEQRGFTGGQAELLADVADARLVAAGIAFQRRQVESGPLQGSESRGVASRFDADCASARVARRIAQAHGQLGGEGCQAAGEHEAAGRNGA